jgi:septum formation protein
VTESILNTSQNDQLAGLILASTSSYRKVLLERLRIPFLAAASGVDEDSYHQAGLSPSELARTLAHAKASAVLNRFPDATVIGSDQLIDLDGSVLGKPGTAEKAVSQLQFMAGRSHRLLTAVSVISRNREHLFLNESRLWMRPLTLEEITRYVENEKPLDCAGSYKIEEAGISLFDRIECSDFTAITGLPLIELSAELRRREFLIPGGDVL